MEGELFQQYIHDMRIIQRFAALSRQAMADEILRGLRLHAEESFTTKAGELLLIPINMRDGSLICRGRGNEDWNYSAPHGAGRLMSRAEAKQSFTVSQFKKEMAGIYTTSVGKSTLDECPMAYKSMEDIAGNIGETVEILRTIRPIYNFKAGDEE